MKPFFSLKRFYVLSKWGDQDQMEYFGCTNMFPFKCVIHSLYFVWPLSYFLNYLYWFAWVCCCVYELCPEI